MDWGVDLDSYKQVFSTYVSSGGFLEGGRTEDNAPLCGTPLATAH